MPITEKKQMHQEFLKITSDEEAATAYVKRIFWPDGPRCPFCYSDSPRHYLRADQSYCCYDCRKSFTLRTNTIFHRTHLPFSDWLKAMRLVVISRNGISACELAGELCVKRHTAALMLNKIRSACGKSQSDKLLSGIVEADETRVGGKSKNKHRGKRGYGGKTHVAVIRERESGITVAKVVPDIKKHTLQNNIREIVELGSVVNTDELRSYNGLAPDYKHETVDHSKGEYVRGSVYTNGVESYNAVLKRSITGTYHNVTPKYLDSYLNESTFRMNEGSSKYTPQERLDALLKLSDSIRITQDMIKKGIPAKTNLMDFPTKYLNRLCNEFLGHVQDIHDLVMVIKYDIDKTNRGGVG